MTDPTATGNKNNLQQNWFCVIPVFLFCFTKDFINSPLFFAFSSYVNDYTIVFPGFTTAQITGA